MESKEHNEIKNKIVTKLRHIKQTDSCQKGGREDGMKNGKEINQRTLMHNPWTHGHQYGDWLEEEGGGAGWRWGKGEKFYFYCLYC